MFIDEFKTILQSQKLNLVNGGKKHSYYDIICSFDIETYSSYYQGEKVCNMYVWSFAWGDKVITGRTWDDFKELIDLITIECEVDTKHRIIIWVHNLSYEFQFIRKWFKWESVFALDTREPVYALTQEGIEFRCSYILSAYSLATVAKNLRTHSIEKLSDTYDYDLPRHSETTLSAEEIKYVTHDVLIVVYYIEERLSDEGDTLATIPLTKTGYVRRFCRDMCFTGETGKNQIMWRRYHEIMERLTLTSDEYKDLKRAFQGGFTHANAYIVGHTYENVASYDICSSYPSVMVAEKFPMSTSEVVEINGLDDVLRYCDKYCCLFEVVFEEFQSIFEWENYVSSSRCILLKNPVVNNGRVVTAELAGMVITDIDFLIIDKCYTWDRIHVNNFRIYKRGYLPRLFILSILTLYEKKTTLKGVEGMEAEYLSAKEMINSCYGMTVTDIVRDEIEYHNEWLINRLFGDIDSLIEKYNVDTNRFLFYPWGVWVTAYARRNLFSAILTIKDDYLYSDTDSVKLRNAYKYKEYFEKYNQEVTRKLCITLEFYNIPVDRIKPCTKEGKEKPLGIWEHEADYKEFKTLGAKRYLARYMDERLLLTVAGVKKKTACDYLASLENPFDEFTTDLVVPQSHSGRLTHTYLDDEKRFVIVDHTGKWYECYEKSAVHMEKSDYHLSISESFEKFLHMIQGGKF